MAGKKAAPKVMLKGVPSKDTEKNEKFIGAAESKHAAVKETAESQILSLISGRLSGAISAEQMDFLRDMEKVSAAIPGGMSDLQISKFILNDIDFPTDFGKYTQAKLELYSRYEAIVNAFLDYRKTGVEIGKLKAQMENHRYSIESATVTDPETHKTTILPYGRVAQANIDLKEIEIDRKTFQLKQMEQMILVKLRESRALYDTYALYTEFDDLTVEEMAKRDLEFWRAKSKYDDTGRLERYLRGVENDGK